MVEPPCPHAETDYSVEHDNFYCSACKQGMGDEYYQVHRRTEMTDKGRAGACQRFINEYLPAVREVAQGLGYAVAVHGSLERDVDLVAVPWVEDAKSAEVLVEAVMRTLTEEGLGTCGIDGDGMRGRTGPHGRLTFALSPFKLATYIDLSVIEPRGTAPG